MQFGEEVQGVVDLEVTGRGERFIVAFGFFEHGHGVAGGVLVVDTAGSVLGVAIVHGEAGVTFGSVGGADSLSGVVSHSCADSAGVGVAGVNVGTGGVSGYAQVVVEELGSEVEANGGTLHRRSFEDTFVVGEANAKAVGEPTVSTATYGEVVVVGESGAEHFFLPVGSAFAEFTDSIGGADEVGDSVAELSGIHHVEGVAGSVHAEVGGEVNLGAFAGALLGGDDDNAVGCARTVDGGSGSVLKDGHAGDVGGVDHGKSVGATTVGLVGLGHTVDHDQRVVGSVKG